MATELASAYVSLGVSTKGMGKDVKRALGDVEGGFDSTGKKAGKSLGSGLGKGLKVGVLGIAGITAGVAALAAKGGISRALNIEGAQAKLRGLGHDTKSIQTIMDSALASVKGTAFGLGDAATVAASTVAAGVKPGQDLTRTLKLVADASTIAGTSMTDMGLIFNKVAGTGKIQGEVIAQLGERGIPILQLLADEMGVSAAEVGKLASAGKIGFAEFQNAMEKGMGGAALESGTTFTGALSNVNAALGRLGAAVATPGLDTLKAIFNDAIPAIDAVTTAVGPLIQNLSGKMGPAIERASEAFFGWITAMASGESDLSGITALFTPLGQVLKGMAPVLAQMGEQFGALGVQIGTALAPLLPIIVQALTAVLTAVTPLLPVIGGALTTALTAVVTAVTPLVPILGQALLSVVQALAPVLGVLAGAIVSIVQAAVPLIPPIAEIAAQLLPVLAQIVVQVVQALTPLLPIIADLAVQLMPVLATVVTTVLAAIVPLIPIVGELIDALAPVLPVVLDLASELMPMLSEVLLALAPVIVTVVGAVGSLVSALTPVLATVLKFVIPPLKTVITWLVKVVAEVVKFVAKWAAKLAEFVGKVAEAIPDAIQWFKDLPGKIGEIFTNAGTWLLDAGKKIISGFVDGIKGAFSKVKDTLGGLTDMLPDWKGPAKRDATILKPAGKLLMKGLVAGITTGMDDVKKALGNVTDGLAKIAETGVKNEADRLIAARKKANARIAASNKALAKKRDKDLAAADKITDSKKRAAEKKRINAEYKRKKKDPLGTLSRADAEKQAKKNLKTTSAAVKRAQKLVNAQGRTTKDLWNDGRYKGSVQRWQGLNAGTTALLSGLTSSGSAARGASSLVKKATLADVAKAREDVGKALDAAKGVLADMKDARADLAASVSSSIKGELDLTAGIGQDTTTQWGHTVKGETTFRSVAGQVKAMAAKARAFAAVLSDLARKGIPAGLIQEVASLGSEQGTTVGKALLSGSAAEVADLSADYAALGSWSDQAGNAVAGSMYDVGIQAQQGLVDGLLSDDAKLAAAAKVMTDKLTAAVKKELGIKSPSRLFRDEVGVMVSRGVIAGMDREQRSLDRRAEALVPTPNVNAAERGNGIGGSGRTLTDGDVAALASAMRQVQLPVVVGDREAAAIHQKGQQQRVRTDPGAVRAELRKAGL